MLFAITSVTTSSYGARAAPGGCAATRIWPGEVAGAFDRHDAGVHADDVRDRPAEDRVAQRGAHRTLPDARTRRRGAAVGRRNRVALQADDARRQLSTGRAIANRKARDRVQPVGILREARQPRRAFERREDGIARVRRAATRLVGQRRPFVRNDRADAQRVGGELAPDPGGHDVGRRGVDARGEDGARRRLRGQPGKAGQRVAGTPDRAGGEGDGEQYASREQAHAPKTFRAETVLPTAGSKRQEERNHTL